MTTFTINLRALKAVSIAAGTEETRYYLNGVNLEHTADGLIMVATDGHRAIVLRQDWQELAPKETPFKSVIVPLAFINKIKLHKLIDVAEMTLGDNGAISIKYVGDMLGTTAIDATFPGWRRIVPTAKVPGAIGHYNCAYVSDFHKAGKLLDKGARSPVILHDGLNPAIVTFYFGEKEGFDTFGVLMPIRTPDDYVKPAPAWVSDRHAAPAEKVAPVDAEAIGLAAVEAALAS
jgi:DNA polymerase-3 subunit beta